MKKLLLGLCVSTMGWAAQAQNGQHAPIDYGQRPQARAVLLAQGPKIDGEVLHDPVWQQVPSIGPLTQSRPRAGQPASEPTDIRIAYDDQNLYVGVVCYDSQPDQLVVPDARRDASLDNADAVLFLLDTYHDGQNGFVFGTNIVGSEYDAQVDNEGQGNFSNNRQQGGRIGGFNLNWDATWTVRTQRGDYGWSAEFAIPLRTLRYRSGQNLTWGFNFQRNIRKNNEVSYWAPLPIQFDLKRVSLAGTLTGLNLRSPGNLKVIPYVLGQANRDYAQPPVQTQLTPQMGGDVKYSITPALTLDLTYNTDFAQVEVDEQQINLDRFNLFFPEKRPFFLENAGFFAVGSPGEVDLFFSRRIGIGPNGEIVPITGGARLSGRVGQTNVGLLSMFTEAVPDSYIERQNFSVARASYEFAQRSAVGGLFVNRQGMGETPDDWNRTYALDGKWGIGKKAQLSGFWAGTRTPGIDAQDHAWRFQARYEWNGLILNAAWTQVGEGFNPEVGFLQRTAFRKPELLIFKRIRPKANRWKFLEFRPHTSYRSYWNFDNFLVTSFWHTDNHWVFESGTEFHTGINFTVEGVLDTFLLVGRVPVPSGTYRHREAQLVFFTNKSKPVYISTRHVLGGFFGGKRYNNRLTLGIRLGDRFSSEFTLNRNDIFLPLGDVTTTIFRSRLSYSFTPRIYVQTLIQYNSVIDNWSANVRFSWLQDANTGLFVVYNEGRTMLEPQQRSLTVKYTRVFDLLH